MARVGGKDKSLTPAVSIVVVAYQSGRHLETCLAALAAQDFDDHEIILLDNASSDGAPQAAAGSHPQVRFVEAGSNLGFAAGVNLAAKLATGRWMALINPDAFADPDWLATLMAATQTWPQVKCFASRQLMAEDTTRLDGLGDVMSGAGFPFRGGYTGRDPGPVEPGEVFSACGGAMLVDRAFFLGLGGFDERLFCYCEDVDFGYRMRLIGEPTIVVPTAVVRHVGSTASGGPRSEFAVFHGTRNRLWVFVKNTPPLLLALTLPLHIFTTALLFLRHADRHEFRAPWRGFMAGLKGLDVALAARRETQATRTAGSGAIARAMTWNPLDLFLRRVVIRRP